MSAVRLVSVAAAFVLAMSLGVTERASAQDLSGAISAGPVFDEIGDVGGGTWVDLWCQFDWFRIGGMTGAVIIPSGADSHNRFATPIALSLAGVANFGDFVIEFRAHGGMWGGSTQEVKMTAGAFVGGGTFLELPLSADAALGAGVEVWGIFGAGQTWAIAPSLTLTFGRAPAPLNAPATATLQGF